MVETEGDGASSRRRQEAAAALLGEWRDLLVRAVDEAERFTREKPAAGLVAAFLAGLFTGSLIRRR